MMKRTLASLACTTLLLAGTAHAQDADAEAVAAAMEALDAALPGDLIHNPMSVEWVKRGDAVKVKVVDAAALPSGQAVSAQNTKVQPNAWDSVLITQVAGEVKKGDEIQVYFWIRTADAPEGAETADVSIFLGRDVAPYDHVIAQTVSPSKDWQIQSVKGTANADFPMGKLKIEYHLGRAAQTVEVGGVYVSKL